MQHKLAQFSLIPTTKANSLGEVFVAQVDLNKEALLGKLFIILEINSRSTADYKLASFLLTELNKNYYQNDKAIMRERLKSITIEQVFESCLSKTNKNLADQLQSKKIVVDLKTINATVGVVFGTEVHFSNLGKNKILLVYKNKQHEMPDKYILKDLTEDNEAHHELSPNKLFANLVNGSVPTNGYLIFTNEALTEYIGSKKLVEIVSTLPPVSAVEQIKQQLSQLNSYISFFGIVIKNTTGQVTAEPAKQRTATAHDSIQDLRTTEAATEKLLMPTGLIDFRKWTDRGKAALVKSKAASSQLSLKSKSLAKSNLPSLKKTSSASLGNIKGGVLSLFANLLGIFTVLINLFKSGFRPSKIKDQFQQLGALLIAIAFSPINWVRRLRKRQQVYLLASVLLLILFGTSLKYTKYRQTQLAEQAAYQTTITQIEQKENLIDSSLIYKNDVGAISLIAEVKNLLSSLKPKTPDQKLEDLKKKFADLEQKIRKVTEVEPKILADLGQINPQSNPLNLILTTKALYAGDTPTKSIYRIDNQGKVITPITDNLASSTRLDSASLDSNLIYYLDQSKIYILNTKKDEVKSYDVKDFNLADATQLGVFNQRLYIYSSKDGQVYRFNFTNNTFTAAKPWLDEKIDTTNLAQFYIDGSVYFLYNNGHVLKFSHGSKQAFELTGLNPKLENTHALTSSDKYLYIGDNNQKAITVFDNTGKYQKMYTSDKFDNIKGVQIDEKNKTGYVLNGKTVYSFDLK